MSVRHLNRSAKQKVITGMELVDAATTVADVNFRLTLYRLPLTVILETEEPIQQQFDLKFLLQLRREINRSMNLNKLHIKLYACLA